MTLESYTTAMGSFLCLAFSRHGRVSSYAKVALAGRVVDLFLFDRVCEDPGVCVCVCVNHDNV